MIQTIGITVTFNKIVIFVLEHNLTYEQILTITKKVDQKLLLYHPIFGWNKRK
jgi:hypothetical protein